MYSASSWHKQYTDTKQRETDEIIAKQRRVIQFNFVVREEQDSTMLMLLCSSQIEVCIPIIYFLWQLYSVVMQ